MLKKIGFLTACCVSGLTGCGSMYQSTSYTTTTPYQPYVYQDTQFYPRSDSFEASYGGYATVKEDNSEANSYSVGTRRTRTSHQDMDRNWVSGQNPNGYTIEIGSSERASQVAAKLYKIPKNDRMAEIKSYRDGKYYYQGVYGSYNSYGDAEKALNNLPPDIKQGATIKNWSGVQ